MSRETKKAECMRNLAPKSSTLHPESKTHMDEGSSSDWKSSRIGDSRPERRIALDITYTLHVKAQK
jgi:hypothetical protein